jgi:hypothetical protein
MRRVSVAGVCVVVVAGVVVVATTLTSASFASSLGFERALLTPLSTPGPTALGSAGSSLDREIAALTIQGMPAARDTGH